MRRILDLPLAVFGLSLVAMWLSARIGVGFQKRFVHLEEDERQDLGIVIPATLTLLGLLVGFSFSLAASRFDQRKNDEEAEANAIGTEYVRAGLLPAPDTGRVRELLKNYLNQRILFYEAREERQLGRINTQTAQLQDELWALVQESASRQPTAPVGLGVSGMNDVLNSQGYTQAAWQFRLPVSAWIFMSAIAIFSSLLIGFSCHRKKLAVVVVVPLVVSIAFLLIADIESPRHGFIRVIPENLISLSQSLRAK